MFVSKNAVSAARTYQHARPVRIFRVCGKDGQTRLGNVGYSEDTPSGFCLFRSNLTGYFAGRLIGSKEKRFTFGMDSRSIKEGKYREDEGVQARFFHERTFPKEEAIEKQKDHSAGFFTFRMRQ